MKKPTLHLMVGLPGSGKTTRAKELEIEHNALRLTPDEWHLHLFGHDMDTDLHDDRHTRVEQVMWTVAQRALKLGVNVIMDFGFWGRDERDGLRRQAQLLGADFQIHFMDVPLDELHRRIEARNAKVGEDAVFRVTREELQLWNSWFQRPTPEELET